MTTPTRYKATKLTFQMSADRGNDVVLTLTHTRKGYVVTETQGIVKGQCGPAFPTEAEAMAKFDRMVSIWSVKAAEAGFPLEYVRRKTGRKIPCPGEAHSNPFIDYCGCCMGGTWGEVDELMPIDLEAAKAARLDVPGPMLDRETNATMRAYCDAGQADLVSVHRGNSSYSVYRWTGK